MALEGNLKGPQGDQGDDGAPGSQFYLVTGAPSGALGVVGDVALDTLTGDLYKKTGISSWTYQGTLSFGGAGNVVISDVDCDSSVYVGAAVRLNASSVAFNALADTMENANLVGIAQAKTSSVKCDIRVAGVSLNIFTGLDPTKEYYLSGTVAGLITSTPPASGSGHVVVRVGQPFTPLAFSVNKGIRIKLA